MSKNAQMLHDCLVYQGSHCCTSKLVHGTLANAVSNLHRKLAVSCMGKPVQRDNKINQWLRLNEPVKMSFMYDEIKSYIILTPIIDLRDVKLSSCFTVFCCVGEIHSDP